MQARKEKRSNRRAEVVVPIQNTTTTTTIIKLRAARVHAEQTFIIPPTKNVRTDARSLPVLTPKPTRTPPPPPTPLPPPTITTADETSIPYFENAGARGLSRGVAAAPSLTGLRIPLRSLALRLSRRKLSFDFPDGAPLEGKLVLLKDSQ